MQDLKNLIGPSKQQVPTGPDEWLEAFDRLPIEAQDTLGQGILELENPTEVQFKIIGALSGRMQAKVPNIKGMPNERSK